MNITPKQYKSYFLYPVMAVVLVSLGAVILPLQVQAAPVFTAPNFELKTVAGGLTLPTAISFAPDGRIFVSEKNGSIKIIKNGVLLATPLIQLTDVNSYGDRGLIGMAIDPNFSSNGYMYLNYTHENTPGADFSGAKTARIIRITVIGDTALESSKVILIGSIGGDSVKPSCENYLFIDDCIPSDTPSHSSGGLAFGPDSKL